MKKSKLKIIVISVFVLLSFWSNEIFAQQYKIVNNSPCIITLDIEVFEISGVCSSCNILTNQSINAGNSYNIPLGSCGTVCNIEITVTDFGGTNQSTFCDFTTGNVTLSGCTGQTIEYYTSTGIFLIN